jgi:hypothetical protein
MASRRARRWRKLRAVLVAAVPALAWAAAIARTGRWPSQDGPHVLGIAGYLALLLRDGEIAEFLWCLQLLVAPHPPGAYVPAVLAYVPAGPGPGLHLLAMALVLGLCIDAMRRLGAGLPGVLWLAAMPLVWSQAESYGVDLIAATCVLQSVSHLVASDRLRRRRSAVAWGAWMGAAFMVKYTAPVFLVGPCLVAGAWVVRHGRWRALAVGVVGFLVVAAPWWVPQLDNVRAYLSHSSTATEQFAYDTHVVRTAWTDPANLSWYPAALKAGWGALGLGVVAGAALLPGHARTGPGARLAPLLGVVGGWLVLADSIIREARYFLPGVVLLAALAGGARLRWLWAGVAAVGAWHAAQTYTSDAPAPTGRDFGIAWETAGARWPAVAEPYAPLSNPPDRWEIAGSLERLRAHHGGDTGTVGLLVDERHGGPAVRDFLYTSALAGHRWHLASPSFAPGTDPVFVVPFATEGWPSREFTTLLAVTGDQSSEQERWLKRSNLVEVERWPLRGGWTGRIYTRP